MNIFKANYFCYVCMKYFYSAEPNDETYCPHCEGQIIKEIEEET